MSERSPYSRVYWTIRDDTRLADVYPNDAHLAAWLRLLIAADMAWPAPADVPASVMRASLDALCAAGVIELLPGGLFRFHGLDSERGRRRESAQAAAAHRTLTERSPNGVRPVPERSASRAEPSKEEPSRETRVNGTGIGTPDDAVEAYFAVTGRTPSAGALGWLNELAADHGEAALCMALRTTDYAPPKTYISRVANALTTVTVKPNGKAAPITEEEWQAQQAAKRKPGLLLDDIAEAIAARRADA